MNVVEKNLSGLERTVFYFGTEEVVYKLNYNYIILKRNKEPLYYPCGQWPSIMHPDVDGERSCWREKK